MTSINLAKLCISLLLSLATTTTLAQYDETPWLNIGDPAPPLRVNQWLKGTPVQKFEKGHVYVVEFWATWCQPCKLSMPHLSTLARQYKNKVTIIGVDIYETKMTSLETIKSFHNRC